MKKILILITAVSLCGCGTGTQSSELITVDVQKNYPKKDLLLQDIADVRYIPLEISDDVVINDAFLRMAGTDKEGNIVPYHKGNEGSVFVFDSNGRCVKRFNRKGGSGEEYVSIWSATYNSQTDELFVYDYSRSRIVVYDSDGVYKRAFELPPRSMMLESLYTAGQDRIVCYDEWDIIPPPLTIRSALDGSVVTNVYMQYSERLHEIHREYS